MNLRILLTPMLSFGRIRAALRKRHPEGIDGNGSRPCATPTRVRRSLRADDEHELETTNYFHGHARGQLVAVRRTPKPNRRSGDRLFHAIKVPVRLMSCRLSSQERETPLN